MRRAPDRRSFVTLALAWLLLALVPSSASATWSIIAVDAETGWVVIASATCVPQGRFAGFPAKGLMDIQAIVVPGVAVAAAQANVDGTRANQVLIYEALRRGTDPDVIITMLKEDERIESRQFGILDLRGRSAGFSGSGNGAASLAIQGRVRGTQMHFSIQGNILASDAVVLDAVAAFRATAGSVMDRVIAAMEAADAAGGDSRCTCLRAPFPEAPCDAKTAHVAYILGAAPQDPEGVSFNDGEYSVFIDVTDENIQPHENANPVHTLKQRYIAWKAQQGAR